MLDYGSCHPTGAKSLAGSTRATMIHDSTPHRIFKIGELTRLIAGQLVLIDRKSTLNFARASRCLEEPVLSTLWETQQSLVTLLEVLPKETWIYKDPEFGKRAVRCPRVHFDAQV